MELDNIVAIHWLLLIDTNCDTLVFSILLALEKRDYHLEHEFQQLNV